MKQPARRKRRAKGGDDGGTVPPDKNDFFKKRTLKMHTIVATDEAEEDVTIMPSFAGWTFACLGTYVRTHEYVEDATTLFTVTLPYMVSTALALPLLFPSHVPLLTRQVPSSVTLTKRQAACLIIHAFLCTFTAANTSFNHFHFFDVFAPSAPPPWSNAAATDQDATAVQKLLTVLHYFSRFTTDNLCDNTNHQYDQQVITYARHVLDTTTPWTEGGMAGDGGGWADTLPWSPVQVHANGAIEDDVGAVQVDFANKFAGGGVLGHGCVQEEIRFLMNPECLVACLLTEVLGTRSIPSVSGILFENKCDYTTWFSASRECIHGIQMLPVSPVLEFSRPLSFVAEEWADVLCKLELPPSNAWQSLLMANYSAICPMTACAQLQHCAMDDGLSRAYALYYSLTRPSS
ncbi:hypothetical protein DYB36_008236 [Aphanomyces astaci]|uniref:glucan endo-1,3-beta-D-glucosidase n=2 Tax=Aphanomyces astaci TaxID=112090 RepID=A0A397A5U5_APHAT|nr:hypothetical protein DYB36_008236 [Aphanomyces astaci]